jgi:hypothetical protein
LDAANLGFLIYGGLEKPGISTYLLMIFISNLVSFQSIHILPGFLNKIWKIK